MQTAMLPAPIYINFTWLQSPRRGCGGRFLSISRDIRQVAPPHPFGAMRGLPHMHVRTLAGPPRRPGGRRSTVSTVSTLELWIVCAHMHVDIHVEAHLRFVSGTSGNSVVRLLLYQVDSRSMSTCHNCNCAVSCNCSVARIQNLQAKLEESS